MTVFQCRCCGAVLEIDNAAKTYCECSFCGVTQTVPILDFDEKTILWERADNLRRGGEYDRAMAVYDRLTELCPDDPDIYWSKTLCRYGVEYVEENGSHKRIPTLNRIQYESVIDDENYRKAVALADSGKRRVYIIWAKQLEDLRLTTLAVTLAEKPYDIFICYKETDANGRRTEDSVIAAQLYKDLTAEGWRVFFSRVTLEDKAGTAFEPYIFAALNSAKIMLAVGTKPEHFNAVWTRNEWSRFLTLTADDPEKTLAVLYKGMLPAQLPEEFAHLRRFDISAPGFYDELIHGIRKTLETSVSRIDTQEQTQTEQPAESADASALLRRARLFLEDGMFERADELCEQALNLDPENADGYLVKLLAECGLSSEDALGGYFGDLTRSGNYAKAIRFGDEELAKRLQGYAESSSYATYCLELDNAVNESQLNAIAKRFDALGYADSSEKAAAAREKAEELRREHESTERAAKYRNAISLYNTDAPNDDVRAENLSTALKILTTLGEYENSERVIADIRKEQAEISERRERKNELLLAGQERKRKLKGLLVRAALIAVPACVAVIIALNIIGGAQLKSKYNAASELLSSGKYEDAAAAFDAMGDYSDAAERAVESRYRRALSLLESGSYDEAKALFGETAGYSDSDEQMLRADYLKAVELGERGDPKSAAELFNTLGGYLDSSEQASLMLYNYAASIEDGDPGEAAELYRSLGNYMDSAEKYLICSYSHADMLLDNNDFDGAAELFKALGSYSDSAERSLECDYRHAVNDMENGDFDNAKELFAALGDYGNSPDKLLETQYKIAERCYESGDFQVALNLFMELGEYSDSVDRYKLSQYKYAEQLAAEENYQKAIAHFYGLGDYMNASEKLPELKYKLAEQLLADEFYDDAKAIFEELGSYSDASKRIAEVERLKRINVKPGEYMTLGRWQQGKNGETEPLEWLVLDRDGTRALVMSKNLVDFMPFGGMNWAESEVRRWLNNDFYSKAFNAEERGRICETELKNEDDKYEGTYGGGDTVDRIFLLTAEEAYNYHSSSGDLRADYTEWGEKKRKDAVMPTLKEGYSYAPVFGDPYWLRSVGKRFCIKAVESSGGISNSTRYDTQIMGIRPVMWIEIGE